MARKKVYYKALNWKGVSPVVKFRWPLPKGKKPGEWVRVPENIPIQMCYEGIHACEPKNILDWVRWDDKGFVSNRLFEIELDTKEMVVGEEKVASRAGRLIREVKLSKAKCNRIANSLIEYLAKRSNITEERTKERIKLYCPFRCPIKEIEVYTKWSGETTRRGMGRIIAKHLSGELK